MWWNRKKSIVEDDNISELDLSVTTSYSYPDVVTLDTEPSLSDQLKEVLKRIENIEKKIDELSLK